MTRASGRSCRLWPAPNMRLKLAGARVGRIALPRPRAFFSALPPPCASRHCALSVIAIRYTAAGSGIRLVPTMHFKIEIDRVDDGRWLAEVPDLPGAMTYAKSSDEAMAHDQALAL